MTKTSLGKVTNSGSPEYTNAGAAITKTNYGRVEGATSPYDFYNSPGNIQNQKLQQLNQPTNSTQQTIYYTNSSANPYGNQYDKNNFRW